jgi:hypothetical protein
LSAEYSRRAVQTFAGFSRVESVRLNINFRLILAHIIGKNGYGVGKKVVKLILKSLSSENES